MTHLDQFAAALKTARAGEAGYLWGSFAHNLTVAAREAYLEPDPERQQAIARGMNELLHRVTAELWSLASTGESQFGQGALVEIARETAQPPRLGALVEFAARVAVEGLRSFRTRPRA